MTPEYAAGFFDADGSVAAYARAKGMPEYVQVNMVNTCREVLEQLQARYGGKIELHRDGCYLLRLTATPSKFFLEDVLPYVIVKRNQVKVALEIIGLPRIGHWMEQTHRAEVRSRRTALANQLREMKRCPAQ